MAAYLAATKATRGCITELSQRWTSSIGFVGGVDFRASGNNKENSLSGPICRQLCKTSAAESLATHRFSSINPFRAFHVLSTTCRYMSTSSNAGLEAISQMPSKFPSLEFSDNPYELHRHGKGESHHPSQPPALIVHCRSTQDVQAVVQYCFDNDINMIPFGAGTSLEGHVGALQPNTLSIDLAKYMTNIHSIPDLSALSDNATAIPDALAVVEAGVSRSQLNAALRSTGFQFTVDPGASEATIGGMVATSASGTTTVRYGTMKENILELTAVLATSSDAPIVRVGTKALKSSAGYDLLSLLCGSEGTLGIITNVTVKLHPVPQHVVALTCNFQSLQAAAQGVSTLISYGCDLVRCELLDVASIEAFNESNRSSNEESKGNPLPSLPTLFLELSGVTEAALQEQVNLVQEILSTDDDSTAGDWKMATKEQERAELWRARHGLYYAALQSRPGSSSGAVVTDACVPLSELANVLTATARDVEEQGVIGPCFGHAGDGNFHCILPILENDDESYWNKIRSIKENLVQRTLQVGGTCTGEHGIGYDKKEYLKQQYSGETIEMMKVIKRALDPKNILNPGKVVDV